MSSKHKILVITMTVVFLFVALGLLSIPVRQNISLRGLVKEVDNIPFPTSIEKIAIKSAIGDSGGNGNYSTLRVVLAVKTDLDKDALEDALENINLHFPNHYAINNNVPIFYVTQCNGTEFKSSRDFKLDFGELRDVSDYSDYYFIEFVE